MGRFSQVGSGKIDDEFGTGRGGEGKVTGLGGGRFFEAIATALLIRTSDPTTSFLSLCSCPWEAPIILSTATSQTSNKRLGTGQHGSPALDPNQSSNPNPIRPRPTSPYLLSFVQRKSAQTPIPRE